MLKATFAPLNWVAPSTLKSNQLEGHDNNLSFLANTSKNNIMPILMPQFAYKKGQLYLAEKMVTAFQISFPVLRISVFLYLPKNTETRIYLVFQSAFHVSTYSRISISVYLVPAACSLPPKVSLSIFVSSNLRIFVSLYLRISVSL